MKKYIALTILILVALTLICRVVFKQELKPDELNDYTGRYQMQTRGKPVYVDITINKGELMLTNSWDGYTRYLGYLNQDNFIEKGFGWSVKYVRDRQNYITEILAFGTEHWIKINKDSGAIEKVKRSR